MKKLLLAILIVVLAVPAFAYEIALPGDNNKLNVYGSIRMSGLYNNVNDAGVTTAASDENDFLYGIQSNSRFGVKLNLGNFFGTVETNFSGDNSEYNMVSTDNVGLGFRLLFAGYKFDNGLSFTVGRQFVLAETQLAYDNVFESDNGMTGYGGLSAQRVGMIKLGFSGFELAIVSMNPYYSNYGKATAGTVHVTTGAGLGNLSLDSDFSGSSKIMDKIIPMFELAYNLNFDMLKGKIFASYAGLDVEGKSSVAISDNMTMTKTGRNFVNSFTAGAVLKSKFDALSVVLSGYYSMNGELTGKVKNGSAALVPTISASDVRVESLTDIKGGDITGFDTINSYGVVLSIGYDITPAFNVTIGGGIAGSSSNAYKYNKLGDNGATAKLTDYSLMSYGVYVVAPIKCNQYVMFLPTVGYYSYDKEVAVAAAGGVVAHDIIASKGTMIAGVQFRVNF